MYDYNRWEYNVMTISPLTIRHKVHVTMRDRFLQGQGQQHASSRKMKFKSSFEFSMQLRLSVSYWVWSRIRYFVPWRLSDHWRHRQIHSILNKNRNQTHNHCFHSLWNWFLRLTSTITTVVNTMSWQSVLTIRHKGRRTMRDRFLQGRGQQHTPSQELQAPHATSWKSNQIQLWISIKLTFSINIQHPPLCPMETERALKAPSNPQYLEWYSESNTELPYPSRFNLTPETDEH